MGRISGPLSCLVSPFWTFRAQPEKRFCSPIWKPLSSVSSLPMRQCHVAVMAYWTKELAKKHADFPKLCFEEQKTKWSYTGVSSYIWGFLSDLPPFHCWVFPLLGNYCFYLLFLSLCLSLSPLLLPRFPPFSLPHSCFCLWQLEEEESSPSTSPSTSFLSIISFISSTLWFIVKFCVLNSTCLLLIYKWGVCNNNGKKKKPRMFLLSKPDVWDYCLTMGSLI